MNKKSLYQRISSRLFWHCGILAPLLLGGAGGGLLSSCADDDDCIPDVTAATCPDAITMQLPAEMQRLIYTDNTGADVLPLVVGESVQLGYTLEPADATFNSVVWTTSDETVATVATTPGASASGIITAVSERGLGYSIITVSPTGMFSGSGVLSALKVKVAAHLQQASEITLTADETEVYEGEQLALSYSIEPEATTYRTLEWSSSDQNVATVDSKGVVTGVSTGGTTTKSVTITGKAMDGSGVQASISITVKRIVQPQSVTLDQAYSADNGYAFALNEQGAQIVYTTVPAEATQSQIEWTSSDESVATVESGFVTFKGFGEVTITATCPETGNKSTLKMNIPVGLLRETFHNPAHYSVYNATQSGNGTSSSHEWHDGYITITTYTQNATNQHADISGSQQGGDWLYTVAQIPFTAAGPWCSDKNHEAGKTQNGFGEKDRGQLRPGYEIFYKHYKDVSGSYFVKKYAEVQRPECGAGDARYGSNSGAFDQIGWGTLMLYQ